MDVVRKFILIEDSILQKRVEWLFGYPMPKKHDTMYSDKRVKFGIYGQRRANVRVITY
jgi:hypothetical protein